MKYCIILLLIIGIGLTGCLERVPDDTTVYHAIQAAPIVENSTTGTMQYDYKAGPPNVYTTGPNTVENNTNPYLVQPVYKPIDSYFTPMRPSAPASYWAPMYYNYVPVSPVGSQVVFWTGQAEVTVE